MSFRKANSSKTLKPKIDNNFPNLKEKGNHIIERIDDILSNYDNFKEINCNDVLLETKSLLSNITFAQNKIAALKKGYLPSIEPSFSKNKITNITTLQTKQIKQDKQYKSNSEPLVITPKQTLPKKKKGKGTFMTDVGIINSMDKLNDKNGVNIYLEDVNNKVKDLFNNIDDSFYDSDKESNKIIIPKITKEKRSTSVNKTNLNISYNSDDDVKLKEDKDFFIKMIKEIEDIKLSREKKESELEALIRITKDTSKNLDKHFHGVSKLYKEANIQFDDSIRNLIDEDSDEHIDETIETTNYDYNKNINKIKDNLLNVTGNVLDYHKNLEKVISNVKSNNQKYLRSQSKIINN